MQVETANAPATAGHDGHTFYFWTDRCRERFATDPAKFAAKDAAEPMSAQPGQDTVAHATDPVCGMTIDPGQATASTTYAGRTYHFCASGCRDLFAADPLAYLTQAPDPVCGITVVETSAAGHRGRLP